jgi:SAM-dependent methyltransferase
MQIVRRWKLLIILGCGVWIALIAIYFPYATDAEPTQAEVAKTLSFYQQAYTTSSLSADAKEQVYMKVAEQVSKALHVNEELQEFIREHGLRDKKALEIGAGQGALQDMVDDYTALDISPAAKRFFHKPFVLGSATALPFSDNQFDATWSIFVLEHIATPEQALREMRRVTKDGGFIYLYPAWSCSSWSADGYEVRPYSDFGLGGMIVKASIPIRSANLYHAVYTAPIRVLRFAAYSISKPTTLRYSRLKPNYDTYWTGDSDAASSIDRYEALLWFASRGDECLNCSRGPLGSITESVHDPRLLIRVHKR